MNRRPRLVGLLATLLVVGILIGLPATLLALGASPLPHGIPTSIPTLEQVRSALTTPDDGTLALGVIKTVAWVAWAVLAVSILLEIVAYVRGAHAPRLPGLHGPQVAAHQLVAAAALLFLLVPGTVGATGLAVAHAAPAHAPTPRPVATAPPATGPASPPVGHPAGSRRGVAPQQQASPQPTVQPTVQPRVEATAQPTGRATVAVTRGTYTVQRGDTLSGIAADQLGDPRRWPELADLNPAVAGHPDLIYPGTLLRLPHPTASPADTYTVRAGDTLSGIAERELGDASDWPVIFEASRRTTQPGNVHLSDPDQIDIGQTLTIPDVLPTPAASAAAAPSRGTAPTAAAAPTSATGRAAPAPAPDPGATPVVPATPTPVPSSAGSPSPSAPSAPSAQSAPSLASPVPSGAAQAPPASTGSTGSTRGVEGVGGGRSAQAMTAAPWMLAGLTGAGAMLAGSLLMLLRRRRRAQLRHRRPGRTLPSPDPLLSPVERTVTGIGSVTAATVEHMDAVLRRLAAAAAGQNSAGAGAGATMLPDLAAVELSATHLSLHLADPAHLPDPWEGTSDGYHWAIRVDTALDAIGPDILDQPAPYPLLVTIGVSDGDHVWLLNVEDLTVMITGDPTYGQDFARYLAAEIACNPWSAGVTVSCVGLAAEVAALNPDRIHTYHPHHDPHDPHDPHGPRNRYGTRTDPIADQVAAAVTTIDRCDAVCLDVPTARARQADADAWPARMLLVDAGHEHPGLDQLLDLIHTHPGQVATSVVVRGHRPRTPGTVLEVTADGRVNLPDAGLNLIAVGLTSDEAQGCAALLAHSELVTPTPVPQDPHATDGWRSYADQAGALRHGHTLTRATPPPRETARRDGGDPGPVPAEAPAGLTAGGSAEASAGGGARSAAPAAGADGAAAASSSLLEHDDITYLDVAATTREDLQVLAPRVPDTVRHDVEEADPTLDDDVAMWFREDSALPKLRLLGPVRATTRGKPLTKRKPYMTELLTYIALQRLGATPEEIADTFTITKAKVRDYVLIVRQWLGTNPRTGDPHMPDARTAPAAAVRGVPVYEVVDLLIDLDLFRRLRLRGEARGTAGIEDLRTALRLVEGRPFDYPIEREAGGGWTWLVEGDRVDEHMAVAVVDVAHVVTTHALAEGDLSTARLAAETAALAAPYEEIPRLDLAAVAAAEGHYAEAQRIIRDEVCNRTDDEGPPPELSERTNAILSHRQDWHDSHAS